MLRNEIQSTKDLETELLTATKFVHFDMIASRSRI